MAPHASFARSFRGQYLFSLNYALCTRFLPIGILLSEQNCLFFWFILSVLHFPGKYLSPPRWKSRIAWEKGQKIIGGSERAGRLAQSSAVRRTKERLWNINGRLFLLLRLQKKWKQNRKPFFERVSRDPGREDRPLKGARNWRVREVGLVFSSIRDEWSLKYFPGCKPNHPK